jgi:hypothetical protein
MMDETPSYHRASLPFDRGLGPRGGRLTSHSWDHHIQCDCAFPHGVGFRIESGNARNLSTHSYQGVLFSMWLRPPRDTRSLPRMRAYGKPARIQGFALRTPKTMEWNHIYIVINIYIRGCAPLAPFQLPQPQKSRCRKLPNLTRSGRFWGVAFCPLDRRPPIRCAGLIEPRTGPDRRC